MNNLRLGSLFSGSGGFELAAIRAGITPVWNSEIEPFPIRVTEKRLPTVKHYGDIRTLDGATLEPVDIVTFGSPCFPAGTLILTDKGYLPIESVAVGDRVLTHKGRWCAVTAVGSSTSKTVVVRSNHHTLECTPNHPIYSECTPHDGSPIWREAEQMKGYYWGIPVFFSKVDVPITADTPPFDEDLFYHVGHFLGNGGEPPLPSPLKGTCAKSDKPLPLSCYTDGNGNLMQIKPETANWIAETFTRTIPSWVYCLPQSCIEAIIAGLRDSCGIRAPRREIKLKLASKAIAHSVRLLGEICGYTTTVYAHYIVQFTHGEHYIDGLQAWYRVGAVERQSGEKQVYNMTVDTDNSYIADGVVVHNCQDMSIAGARAGLSGSRSGLFFEAIRIIREMRENGQYPRYAVWENVLGALSSSGGEDFRHVLEAFCPSISIPKPPKWEHSGAIVGDSFSVAWRVLDAQFWGVPQRRRRIYLVADFDGRSAPEILFDAKGLSGNSASCARMSQDPPDDIGASPHGTICLGGGEPPQANPIKGNRKAGDAPCSASDVLICLDDQGGQCMSINMDISGTLRATANHPPCVLFENHAQTGDYRALNGTAPTIVTRYGTGGNNQPLVVSKDSNPRVRRLTPTECARLQGFPDGWCADLGDADPSEEAIEKWSQIFTEAGKPKSRARIIAWLRNPYSDAAAYKMWGNGICLNCATFVLSRIAESLRR